MENNEMDEAKIEAVVTRAVAPLSTKVDALETKVDALETKVDALEVDVQSLKGDVNSLKGDVRTLVYWTVGTSLTTIVIAMGLVGFAISVFGNHMQSMQLLISALQLPAAN